MPRRQRSDESGILLSGYLERLAAVEGRGDAREESFYPTLVDLITRWAERSGLREVHVTTIPRKTRGCSLDFQVWRDRHRLAGYIEAKRPSADLDREERSEQVQRYRNTFPNLILTNFRELRLYRNGLRIARVAVAGSWPPRLPLGERETTRREAELSALLKRFVGFERPERLSSAALAKALAERTRFLSDRIGDLLERDKGREEPSELTGFYRTLASHLFSKLSEAEFAGIYSQTVAYGLLAARCWEDGELDRRTLYERIPPASGILRDVFRYISLSPPPEIEWIVDDLVDLLRPARWKLALQRHFQQRGDQDPILHFYETFLKHYDPELRSRRGVFYTPPAVVSYVVRSLDHLLRTRLDRPGGLADPRVWLLDPAAGTMTFVVEAFRCAIEGWAAAYGRAGVPALIRDHLLPRSFGFELMMAPYAIGHLKMSLFLAEKGYALGGEDRVNLLLTNALEKEDLKQGFLPGLPSLAREVRKAAEVKEDRRICVVLGNPPYSGHSANPVERKNKKKDPLRAYYQVDGEPLGEKNVKWLQDDYVKFLRFAQSRIDESGEGVVGLVLNHGYLDNPTFRGLRRSLMDSFEEIYVLDLHGNRRKREVSPDGARDENVFDIEQGVSILLAVKFDPVPPLPDPLPRSGGEGARLARVYRADLYGNRAKKLRWLTARDVESTLWTELQPRGPSYLFVERDARLEELYVRGIPLPEIFPEHSVGVLTARDAFVMDFELSKLRDRIIQLRKGLLPRDIVPDEYPRDTGSWKLAEAVRRAGADAKWETRFTEILYRPFDLRQVFYADYLVERPRERVMGHLLRGQNLALVVPRQSKDGPGALVTERVAAHKAVSAYDINYVFPLYLLPEGIFPERTPNVSPGVLRFLERAFGVAPKPEEILGYVYAVLYSNRYRDRYAAFLASDFPRILFPRDRYLFDALAGLGAELVDLHLPGRPLRPTRPTTQFLGQGSGRLGRTRKVLRDYRADERRVYVNEERQLFDGIPSQVWEYRIGGYQVLDRWLQDRAGRKLTSPEIQDFCRTATALGRTVEVQKRIDELYLAVEESAEALTPRPPLPVHPSTPAPGEGETY
ncbi:MAG TPA: type ISP restriction/modification enzyme [Thermoanaerobaculia bacterium]|nr:type ISP restriction/modification enzyme [Thermoanaerobaculia bacterium]